MSETDIAFFGRVSGFKTNHLGLPHTICACFASSASNYLHLLRFNCTCLASAPALHHRRLLCIFCSCFASPVLALPCFVSGCLPSSAPALYHLRLACFIFACLASSAPHHFACKSIIRSVICASFPSNYWSQMKHFLSHYLSIWLTSYTLQAVQISWPNQISPSKCFFSVDSWHNEGSKSCLTEVVRYS